MMTLCAALGLQAQEPGGSLSGSVRDPEGLPARGVEVRVERVRQTVRTNDEGHYRFESLPPGRYTLRVLMNSQLAARRDGVEIAAGEARLVDFELVQAGAVRKSMVVTGSSQAELLIEARVGRDRSGWLPAAGAVQQAWILRARGG